MIWDFIKRPGQFVILKPGEALQNRINPEEWVFVDKESSSGYYLYDVNNETIIPLPQNAMYVVTTVEDILNGTSLPSIPKGTDDGS